MKVKIRVKGKRDGIAALLVIFVFIFILTLAIIKPQPDYKRIATKEEVVVRKPAVAGMFYPAEKAVLRDMISKLLNKTNTSKHVDGSIRGLVMPHAGYVYSGIVAASAVSLLRGKSYKTVIIMGPSHHKYFKGISIANVTHYETPLGMVKLSEKVKEMRKESMVVSEPLAHMKEHSIEVEIPFLQSVLGEFEIIPIIFGDANPKAVARMLERYIDDSTLVIVSSDLSHYYPYNIAIERDKICIEAIPKLNFSLMERCEACGKLAILTLMYIAKDMGWQGRLIEYKNSGDTAGNKQRVVGYASIAFYKKGLEDDEKVFLLRLARKVLEERLGYGRSYAISNVPEKLKEVKGCFVTLKKHGQLRGCIGHILPREPLYKCVIDNTINAALHDIRFFPVRYEELKDIEIEISVLSVPVLLKHESWQEVLNSLVPLRDGVVLKRSMQMATYLPQVWEQIPDKVLFLEHLCMKAGMEKNCWKDKATEIYIYHADVFSESEFNLYNHS